MERPNVPECLITPFGPNGGGKVLNYDIIEFPEEGNTIISNQREFPSLKSGRGQMAPKSRRLYKTTTEEFETVNANQGHIWPLYPHSTVPTAPRSILRDVQCYIDHGMGSYVFNLIINSLQS